MNKKILITTEKIILKVIKLLPIKLKVLFSQYTISNVKLDYKARDIFLSASSKNEFYRRKSCEKEPETVRWLEKNLAIGDVFWDIGANVGAYTLIAANLVGDQGDVISFEPEPSNFYALNRNIRLNKFSNVTPLCLALADENKVFEISLSSFEPGSASHDWGLIKKDSAHLEDGGMTQKILCANGDFIINELKIPLPKILKIDVDGAELLVIKGLDKILKFNVAHLIIELSQVNYKIAMSRLKDLGFEEVESIDKHEAYNILLVNRSNV